MADCSLCAVGTPRHEVAEGRYAHWKNPEGDDAQVVPCGANEEPSAAQVLVTAARNRLENALIGCDDLASLRAHAREAWMDLRRALGEIPVDTSS